MKSYNIYEAKVVGIDDVPTKEAGIYNKLIKVVSVDALLGPGGERYVFPPSFMPFNNVGSGVTSLPLLNSKCLVLAREGSEYDQILTYMPWDAVGPDGVYIPERVDPGSTVLKVGGKVKTALTLGSSGLINLYCDPEAFIKLEGIRKHIEITCFSKRETYSAGHQIFDFSKKHIKTGAEEIGEYKFLFAKKREVLTFSDQDLETEITNKFGATVPYNDKVVVRAGTIFNYDANLVTNKEKTEVGHVYQIETRQNTKVANEKDTVTCLRIGYQKKDNLKYTADTKYPAGTLIEWTAKRVNGIVGVGDYSSFVMRYGKLEDDTTGSQAEKTKGEIYRVQVYDKVVESIAVPALDPVGAGRGYTYIYKNNGASEQYTLSFGHLSSADESYLKDSFYRVHTHSFPGLSVATKSMYTGLSYSEWFGGKSEDSKTNYFQRIFTEYSNGKKSAELVTSYTKESYLLKSTQFTSGTEKTYEKIEMKPDDFCIELKIDDKQKYIVKFAAGSMKITLDTGQVTTTSSIELKKDGKIILNPGTSKSANAVYIGGNDIGQQLVTKAWLDMVFANHIHPTAGPGVPTLPPQPIPVVSAATPTSHTTFITKVE